MSRHEPPPPSAHHPSRSRYQREPRDPRGPRLRGCGRRQASCLLGARFRRRTGKGLDSDLQRLRQRPGTGGQLNPCPAPAQRWEALCSWDADGDMERPGGGKQPWTAGSRPWAGGWSGKGAWGGTWGRASGRTPSAPASHGDWRGARGLEPEGQTTAAPPEASEVVSRCSQLVAQEDSAAASGQQRARGRARAGQRPNGEFGVRKSEHQEVRKRCRDDCPPTCKDV